MVSTGFFMKINKINQMNFLITCFHCIPSEYFEKKEIINIYYGKREVEKNKQIKLDEDQRFIKRDEKNDVILIEILKSDNIPDYRYLYPDLNYKNGYDLYKSKKFYLAGYPSENNDERCCSSGEIKKIFKEKYQFIHSLDTEEGSSGSPICQADGLFVIGIHNGSLNNNPYKKELF
jgi:V8-like Glu-specific endopeptidase